MASAAEPEPPAPVTTTAATSTAATTAPGVAAVAESPAPRAVVATSALLFVLAPALLARQAPWSAAWMLLAALLPWWPRRRMPAIVVAYAGLGLFLWNVARVPLGARASVYALGVAALGLRVWALRTEAARRWCERG